MNQEDLWDAYIEMHEDEFSNDGRIRYDNLKDIILHYKGNGNKNLLEIGFGYGYFIEKLSNNFKCFGIDYSPKIVEFAKNRFESKKINISQQNIENTNFEDNYFDVIIAVEVIEHLPDSVLNNGIKEVKRILKPGGVFIGSVPADEYLKKETVFCPYCKKSFHKVGHQNSFSKENLKNLFKKDNFQCEIKRMFFDDKQDPLPRKIFTKLRRLYITFYKKDKNQGGNYVLIAKKSR